MGVLSNLEQIRDQIPSPETVLDVEEDYAETAWVELAAKVPSTWADDINWLRGELPAPISRRQIIDIGKDRSERWLERTALASLMWGYGMQIRRYNYMHDLALLFDDDFSERLVECEEALSNGSLPDAYERLIGIRGVGPAFFTKLLYFIGRSDGHPAIYPLILDTLVVESLGWLTGHRTFARVSYYPLPDSSSYEHYVTSMHGWAEELSTTAECLEFFLWDKSSRKLIRQTCAP